MGNHLYLMPAMDVVGGRQPMYLFGRLNPTGFWCRWAMCYYGFIDQAIVYVTQIADADHATLATYPDVYVWPANLDQPIAAQDPISGFLATIQFPTDWTTPSTTYRELLRDMYGVFQFQSDYARISGINDELLGGLDGSGTTITLDTRFRDLRAEQRTWMQSTVNYLGYNVTINQNQTLRQLLHTAGQAWNKPFQLGGFVF